MSDSCLCPGCFNLWMYDPSTGTEDWIPLLHVDSWNLADDVEEAPRKRTSSTSGQSIKFCTDIVGYDLEVTNTLCGEQWLYCQILQDPRVLADGITTWFFAGWDCDYAVDTIAEADIATPGGSTPRALLNTQLEVDDTASTGTAILGMDGSYDSTLAGGYSALSYTLPGVVCFGTVRPPSFGGDNTGNDVATAAWSVNTRVGPFLPNYTCAADGKATLVDPADAPDP